MIKLTQIQTKIEVVIKDWYTNLDKKKRGTVVFIPKIVITMLFCAYFSGFIYTRTDIFVSVISCILISIIILFLPITKILTK